MHTPLTRRQLLAALLLASVADAASAAPRSVDATQLVRSAREQVGVTLGYDPRYQRLAYPGGDVPRETGVCTDVVIRALRAQRIDLQKEVHEDMRAHFGAYPRQWGLSRPDRNIDHRRVPNLMTFFKRRGQALPVSRSAAAYRPGDIVTWDLGRNTPHIGIVSDRKTAQGEPMIIHNIGAGTREEGGLFAYRITGHYRITDPR
ncbi:DUF1287 domain-containing protein [Schlegelella sp. S2-27]|uniref:DUF1287 domain-containing protein n=1 Tax=Caldimonas mangrovi TaxID=2944811 RepID=A0ABT0YV19_9BURK|nr:DUF1287 domain-containing protein [Caldimonas mangrovi]MCM5682453.1 DUF1287 domain-containing protein [Caldimonas mangrovi]